MKLLSMSFKVITHYQSKKKQLAPVIDLDSALRLDDDQGYGFLIVVISGDMVPPEEMTNYGRSYRKTDL